MYQPPDHRLIPFPPLLHFMGDNVVRDIYRSSSLDSRVFPLDADTDTDPEVLELRKEVERLRAALVEKQADYIQFRELGTLVYDTSEYTTQARAVLVAEGLLPDK